MMAAAKPGLQFIQLTEEEIARFRVLAQGTYDRYLSIGGPRAKELLDALTAEIERHSAR